MYRILNEDGLYIIIEEKTEKVILRSSNKDVVLRFMDILSLEAGLDDNTSRYKTCFGDSIHALLYPPDQTFF